MPDGVNYQVRSAHLYAMPPLVANPVDAVCRAARELSLHGYPVFAESRVCQHRKRHVAELTGGDPTVQLPGGFLEQARYSAKLATCRWPGKVVVDGSFPSLPLFQTDLAHEE